jgi:hypothetical protein
MRMMVMVVAGMGLVASFQEGTRMAEEEPERLEELFLESFFMQAGI